MLNQRQPLVSVIIVNYNGDDVLERCITSVMNSDYPNKEVILIDNHSGSHILDIVAERFPISTVRCASNIGFAAANNLGMNLARGQYILLLNNDAFVEEKCISTLVETAISEGTGFYQPKILFAENPHLINSAGNMITLSGFGYCNRFRSEDDGKGTEPEEIGYASGACLLTSRECIDSIGMLETALFAYHEDLDWGWRGRISGQRSVYVPSAIAYHVNSHSWRKYPKTVRYLVERNRLFVILKNYSPRTLVLLSPIIVSTEFGVLLTALANGWIAEKFRGYTWLIQMSGYLRQKRRDVSKARTVSDRVVCSIFTIGAAYSTVSAYFGLADAIYGRIWSLMKSSLR